MPFQDSTRDKLMGILGWPVSSKDYIDYLQSLMDDVVLYGGDDAIARIESLIDEYDDAQAAVTAAVVSTQSSMTKADVVEWNPKLTAKATGRRVSCAVGQIKQALGVSAEPFGLAHDSGCCTGLYGLDVELPTRPLRLRRG
jgi:hypothetical protein